MRDPVVGVVTCLYRPVVEVGGNPGSRRISTEYHASILVARSLEGMKFALGPTIVIRKLHSKQLEDFWALLIIWQTIFNLATCPPRQAGECFPCYRSCDRNRKLY